MWKIAFAFFPPSGDSSHYAMTPWDYGFTDDDSNERAKKAYRSVLTITAASSAGSEQYQA